MRNIIKMLITVLLLGSCAEDADKVVVDPELRIAGVINQGGFKILVSIFVDNKGSVEFQEVGALTSSKKEDQGFEIQTPLPKIPSNPAIQNQGFVFLDKPGVYYVRPYAKDLNGKFYEGEEAEINTGKVEISDFSPKIGGAGDIIAITGSLFSNGTVVPEVLIGDVKADIVSLTPTTITVRVPLGIVVSPVLVVVKAFGLEFTLGELEWRKGLWTRMPDYIGTSINQTQRPISFTVNESGYVGNLTVDNKIWKFNTLTNIWSESNAFPGEVGFGGQGFQFQNGIPAYITRSNEEWWYVPPSNLWIQRLPFPSPTVDYVAFAFSIGTESYVGKRYGSGSAARFGVWKKHEADLEWTQLSDCPSVIASSVALTLDGKTYLIGGLYFDKNEVWRYDPILDEWTQMGNGPFDARSVAVGFIIGNKIYYGGGRRDVALTGGAGYSQYLYDFYEYTPSNDQWIKIKDFPGTGPGGILGSFVVANKGYVIQAPNQFYRLEIE